MSISSPSSWDYLVGYAWFGNSQAFALSQLRITLLENLTYAVTHHTAWGIPHLYTLTNLYRSFGLSSWGSAVLALLVTILLDWKDRKSASSVCFQVSLTMGRLSWWGCRSFSNLLYVIPFLLIPLVNMAIAALTLCLNLMPAVRLSGAWNGTPSAFSMLYWERR